jgi:RHS repeat-associated protein
MGLSKRLLVSVLSVLLVLCSCPTVVNRSLGTVAYAEEASPPGSSQDGVSSPAPSPEQPAPSSPTPKGPIELGELRTPFAKTILRDDGLYQAEISLAPIYREDADGHLKPTNELFTTQRSNSALTYGQGKDKIILSRSPSSNLYSLEKGDARLTCELVGASLPTAQESDQAVTYANVFPATDFQYQFSPYSLKEAIVLQDPQAPASFTFRFRWQGLSVSIDGAQVSFLDAASGEKAFAISPPFAQDAAGKRCSALQVSTSTGPDFLDLTVQLDAAWLQAKGRSFPVVIDPTIILQPASLERLARQYDDSYSPVEAGYRWYLHTWEITWWDQQHGEWLTDYYEQWVPNPRETLMQFALPSLPSGVTIQQATLSLKIISDTTTVAEDLHVVTSSWDGSTTWATRPSSNATAITGSADGQGWKNWDVTSAVSSWYSGSTNYGFVLDSHEALPANGTRYKNQTAPENPPGPDKCDTFGIGQEEDPKLTIVYSANDASGQNLGRESHWTYFEMPLPAASAGVNVSNGNLVLSQTDISLPSRGIPAVLSRTYNSRSNRSGLFGYGWSSSLELKLTPSGDGSRVDFFDADGTCLPFSKYKTLSGLDYYTSPPGFAGALQRNTSTATYSIGFQDNASYSFDSGGKITSFIDHNGNTLTWQYSGGQLTGLQDSVNRQVNLSYTGGRITSVTDYSNRSFSYSYTGGFLTSVSYTATLATYFTYTASLLTTYQDPGGKNWTFAYSSSKLSTFTDPLSHSYSFTYPTSSQTQVQNPLIKTWLYDYSTAGLVSRVTDPLSYHSDFTFNNDFTPVSTTDARGKTTHYSWDDSYHVRVVTNAMGGTVTTTYDVRGNPLSIRDQRGKTTTATYDSKNNLLRSTNPLGYTSTCTYDSYGQLIRADQPLTSGTTLTATYTYDNYGNCTQMEDSGGHTVTTSYTSLSLVSYTIDKAGAKTSYSYNTLGWLLSVTDTLRNTTSCTYDACGRQFSSSDSLGLLGTNTYDDAGRLIRTVSPTLSYYDGTSLTQTTTYNYDAANRQTSVIDPAGKTTSYTYDDISRLKSASYPDGTTSSCTYDALNMTSSMDKAGHSFSYSYDDLNRLIQMTASDQTITCSYEANGLLKTRGDSQGTTSYSYDDNSRLTQMQSPQGTISYGYNYAGMVTTATYPQGTVKYTYDSEGRLSNITRPDNSWLGISYDSGDRVSGVAHYASSYFLWTRYTYDDLSRVKRLYNYNYGPTLDLSYSYDARSNFTSKTTTTASGTVTCSYSYDSLGHLATSSQNGNLTRFSYDVLGNRSKMNTTSGTSSYSYDASSGRMLTSANTPSGNTTFSYDINGNLKTKVGPTNTTTYTYDTLNHLAQIVQGGTTLATYSYNGAGQRVCKVANGVTSNYLWDGSNLAQENRGGTYYIYSYLGANPIAMTSGGSSQAFENDGLGTVLGVVNSSGTEIARYTTDDFGNSLGVVGSSPNPFRFAGAFLDSETGLYQMRGRYYDPNLGRFLTVDINPGNPYSYCGNNPTSKTDPSGWFAEATQRYRTDGGPGLASDAYFLRTLTAPDGQVIYVEIWWPAARDWWGYEQRSVSILPEYLNGTKPTPECFETIINGSSITRQHYEVWQVITVIVGGLYMAIVPFMAMQSVSALCSVVFGIGAGTLETLVGNWLTTGDFSINLSQIPNLVILSAINTIFTPFVRLGTWVAKLWGLQ